MRPLALLLATLPLAACSTMTGARPLAPGEHAVGLTVGGGMVELGGPIPLPNTVVEGRHGVALLDGRPLDVNYGLNGTALPFGLLQGHVGASYLLAEQDGGVPALAITNRVFVATNLPGLPHKADPRLQGWGADQVELDFSWALGNHLLFVGLAQYFDFGNPSLVLTPVLGTHLDPGEAGGLGVQLEARWYGIGQRQDLDTAVFFPNDNGALGLTVGLTYRF